MNHVIQLIDTPPRLLAGGGGMTLFSKMAFFLLVAYFLVAYILSIDTVCDVKTITSTRLNIPDDQENIF